MNIIAPNNKIYNISFPFKTFNVKNIFPAYYRKNQEISNSDNTENSDLNLGLKPLLIIAACLLFSKGIQKNIGRGLEGLKNKLEYKLEINSLKEKNRMFKFFDKCARALTSTIEKSESINNITSLKDILFMKLMYKTKITKNIHKGISNLFDNISRKTVSKSYLKTEKALKTMEARFQMLDNHILKTCGDETVLYGKKEETVRDVISYASDLRKEIYYIIGKFMSSKSQTKRHGYIKSATSRLYQTFWDASFKDFTLGNNKFTRKEMWQTFIAAEQMKNYKLHLASAVIEAKRIMSCSDKDSSLSILQLLSDLRKSIPRVNIGDYEQVKRLEWLAKNTDALQTHKEIFLREFNNLAKTNLKNINLDQDTKNSYIDLITNLIKENTPGKIQELMSVYYKIKPFEFAKSGALQSAKDTVKLFNKSVNLEISEYFDKVRDLELGSAPTDVLTILISAGLISHELLKAKNDNQKTSVMLTSGIPLIGAIATTVISTTKLVSGGKSLALGFISGICLNFIGKFVDNFRIKYLNRKSIKSDNVYIKQ